jgi:uncharacterized protein YjbJ (UPF0337 family)
MNKDQIEGKIDNLKGRAKQAAGTVTGNKNTELDGAADRVKGAVQEKVGDIRHNAAKRLDNDPGSDR